MCLPAAVLTTSSTLAAQVHLESVGVEFGTIKGVPGLSGRKWGPLTGARFEVGGSSLRLVLDADYVIIPSATTCCGPPGGFTYDDHGALAMIGPEFILGSEPLRVGLTTEVGIEEYRQVRRGTVPGFTPPPGNWHGQAIGNVGITITHDVRPTLNGTFSVREYASLTNPRLGGFQAQPSLSLGLSWHRRR